MGSLLRQMYEDQRAYPVYNTFQTAMAVDSPENPLETETIWNCPELIFTKGMSERVTVKSYAYEPGFAPAGKQLIQTLQGGSEEVYSYWIRLYQDPVAYQRQKVCWRSGREKCWRSIFRRSGAGCACWTPGRQ